MFSRAFESILCQWFGVIIITIEGISCPSRSFPVHHAPDVCDISEDEGHKERDVEHGAEGELAAATV